MARSGDTTVAKVSRFVFGAVGGAVAAWFSLRDSAAGAAPVFGTIAVFAVIGGLVAMVLGGVILRRGRR